MTTKDRQQVFFVASPDLPDTWLGRKQRNSWSPAFFLTLLWNPPVAEFRVKIVEPVTLEVFSDYV
jgi:hypothetical protein